jgi:hypothetical protein
MHQIRAWGNSTTAAACGASLHPNLKPPLACGVNHKVYKPVNQAVAVLWLKQTRIQAASFQQQTYSR